MTVRNKTEWVSGLLWKMQLNIPKKVYDILETNYKFVLLAGLGGFSGSSLVRELTIRQDSRNKNFQTICSLPINLKEQKDAKML